MLTSLAYLVFEVADLEAWETFAGEVLGLQVVDRTDSGMALRMDDRSRRLILVQGPADDLGGMGWEVDSESDLEAVANRVREAGVEVIVASPELAASRGARHVIQFVDPGGVPVEVATGFSTAAPFSSSRVPSGFVTGDMGLGHLVVSTNGREQSEAFYTGVLGFGLSDRIVCELGGFHVDIAFLHTNRRHHSLALGGTMVKRIHHFMLEVASLDDVGAALDRAIRLGVPVNNLIGQHPNDRMVSFYATTPSGFQFEFGFGGRKVDEATWKTAVYDRISDWGHTPPQMLRRRR